MAWDGIGQRSVGQRRKDYHSTAQHYNDANADVDANAYSYTNANAYSNN